MEFLLIMGIGTVVATLIVANLPKPHGLRGEDPPMTSKLPSGRRDAAETFTMGDLEYLEKLERHQKDPRNWPCPFPPEEPRKADSEFE